MRIRLGLFAVSSLVQSMLELLLVVVALDLVGMGSGGVGWLRAAFAAGGLAGGAAAIAALGRGRLGPGLIAGLVLAGVPLALVAAWPETAPVVLLLLVLGAGYALIETALLLLTQRLVAPEAIARVAGIEEIAYPIARAAVALLAVPVLRRAERRVVVPDAAFQVLRSLPAFARLPRATLENLALCAAEERFEPEHSIHGNGFRAIASGTVVLEGARLGPGECFGEAALLRDAAAAAAPATAITDVATLTITRPAFIARVTAVHRGAVEE